MQSLEEVVQKFLNLATKKVEGAIVAAGGSADELMEIGDLELEHTPEQVMLKAHTTTPEELEAEDEESLTLRFKFLWETYRNCLEVYETTTRWRRCISWCLTKRSAFASSTRETRNLDAYALKLGATSQQSFEIQRPTRSAGFEFERNTGYFVGYSDFSNSRRARSWECGTKRFDQLKTFTG